MLKVRIIFAVPSFKIYKHINLFAKDSKVWQEKVKSELLINESFLRFQLFNGQPQQWIGSEQIFTVSKMLIWVFV